MSAPADRDASRLYYSYRIIKREILAVVTQSDLSRSHVSWRRGGGGGAARVATPNDCEAPINWGGGGGGYVICSGGHG